MHSSVALSSQVSPFSERQVQASSRGLRVLSLVLVVATLALILKGALVTSHDAGLSVPDWPTSYGYNMFLYPPSEWIGGIFYEHVHRLLASGVGLITVVLMVLTWRSEERRWVRGMTAAALLAVIAQGTLGGLTVVYKLPVAVSSMHAVLAQTFLMITIVIAYSHSGECARRVASGRDGLFSRSHFKFGWYLLGMIYLQLVVAAVMRHSGSGIAVPDFPTMAGSVLPSISNETIAMVNEMRLVRGLREVHAGQVAIHLVHRFLGYAIVVALFAAAWVAIRRERAPEIRKLTSIMGGLGAVQLLLGALAVWTVRGPWVTSLHVVCGAALLSLATILVLRGSRILPGT